MRVWAGTTASRLGDQVTLLALPWLVFLITHSAAQLGIVNALQGLPFLLFTLIAGVYADRWDRRIVMVAADLLRFGALASIPVTWSFHVLTIWQLYAVAFIHGTGRVWFDMANYALLPGIVRLDQLIDANTRFSSTEGATAVFGPALGGVIIRAGGAAYALIADALSFVASATALLTLPSLQAGEPPSEHGVWAQLVAGFRYLIGHRPIADNAWALAAFAFCLQMVDGVFIYYAQRTLHLDAAMTGVLFSMTGLGAVVLSPLAPLVTRRFRRGQVLLAIALLSGPLMAVYDLAPLLPKVAALLLAGAAGGIAWGIGTIWNTITLSYRQSSIPAHLMSRVNSALRFVSWGMWPIGALAGGLLTQTVGIRWVIAIAAFGLFAQYMALQLFSELRRI